MCLGLLSIDDDTIRTVLSDPPLIWKLIAPDDQDVYAAERADRKSSWFSKVFGQKSPPATITETIGKPVEDIDIDKSWNGIHYLLTKTSLAGDPPLNFLILGGVEVGEIDVGYGPARAITSDQVAEIHVAIGKIDIDELRRRYDPRDMLLQEVYPEIWEDDATEEDGSFSYCSEYFVDLKNFIRRAAENRLGIIIHLS